MRVGIMGTGNIANFLLEAVKTNDEDTKVDVISIYGRNTEKGQDLSKKYNIPYYNDIEAFLDSGVDIVVEAMTVEASKELSGKVLQAKKDIVLSSVGVLADTNTYESMEQLAKQNNVQIYIPSGAIGAIDAIKATNAFGELESVSLTTRKPPKSFGLSDNLLKEEIIYDGTAREAIKKFPKNINVSIVLSLAGLGSENTYVKIIADPNITKNTHTIEATGGFGNLYFKVENESMPANPKTSYLAALSILSVLKNRNKPIKIGN